jgi:hypothetical protein
MVVRDGLRMVADLVRIRLNDFAEAWPSTVDDRATS